MVNMGILAASLTKYNFTPSQFEELAALVRRRILSVSSPEMIYIFGSHARTSITGLSDLDIAIIFKNKDILKKEKKIILNSKLFLDYSTDLLFYSYDEFEKKSSLWGVSSIIKQEGKIIYDKRTEV